MNDTKMNHRGVEFEIVNGGGHRASYFYIVNGKPSYSNWTVKTKCIKSAKALIDQHLSIGFGL